MTRHLDPHKKFGANIRQAISICVVCGKLCIEWDVSKNYTYIFVEFCLLFLINLHKE